jgi:L-aspartate semialdehyde sulfurtransferase ferredoxin
MTALNKFNHNFPPKFSLVPSIHEKTQITQIRVRIYIPKNYLKESVISHLISMYGLVVNITQALLGESTGGEGYFNLTLQGTIKQISSGLAYLEALDIKIEGKANVEGDSWHY